MIGLLLAVFPKRWRKSVARSQRRDTSLRLEWLEDRVTPAQFVNGVWTGAVSTDWTDLRNWVDQVSGGAVPRAPGVGNADPRDTARFNNQATQDCVVPAAVNPIVSRLDTGSGQTAFTKKLIVSQNDALTVQSYVVSPGVVQGGIFTFASGTINLQGGADLNLNNTTGNWSGGDLSSTVGGGTVRLYSSAGAPAPTTVLSVYDGGSTLGATLIIGQNSNGTNSPATLNLATSISDMGQMLVLSRSAGIINQPQGVINFNQLRNSATKGGIDMAPGSLSAIRNSGTMWRDIVDAGGDYLTITPPVTDTATGGFFLGTGAAVYFANLYKVNAGAFLVSPGSDAIGVFVGPQGTLSLVSSGQQGAQDQFTFNSDLTVNGGTIQFGYSTGTTEVLNITGNLTINPGSSVVLNVDGRTNGQAADLLNVGGFASINGANLTVNTQEASPASGNTYSFLSAAGGISGSGWAAIFNSGFPANYQIDPANRGQLDVL